MNSLTRNLCVLFLSTLLLAGCGGGGSSSSAPQGGGAGALDAGGSGVTTGGVDDGTGTTVTASFSSALDINDLNQVIGFAEVTAGAPFTAALWSVDADGDATVAPTALASLTEGGFAAAFAIDENGTSVGQADDGTSLVAVTWADGAAPTILPQLAATGNYAAYAVSADGTLIAGEATDGTGTPRAVIWIADDQGTFAAPVQLPVNVFASGTDLSPFSSASGVARIETEEILVVGEAEAGDGTIHAALWRSTNNGGTFAASSLGVDHIAYAVNSARLIAGENDATLMPVSWSVDAAGAAAAPVSLAASGSAVAVNENGRIAGWSADNAAVWEGETSTTLFETSSQAYGLNNDEQPLVVGRNGTQGFVMRVN